MPIQLFKTSLILLASCPARGRFLEATLRRTERELAGPGRPGMVDEAGDDGGASGGAAPYVIGRARLALSAARGGYVIPASKGCVAHTPGASRRSTPLAQVARGTSKPRTLRAARTRKRALSFRDAPPWRGPGIHSRRSMLWLVTAGA